MFFGVVSAFLLVSYGIDEGDPGGRGDELRVSVSRWGSMGLRPGEVGGGRRWGREVVGGGGWRVTGGGMRTRRVRDLGVGRTFFVGCGGTVVVTIMTLVIVVTNMFTCVSRVTNPHRSGTDALLNGNRACFRGRVCRRTLGNSNTNCMKFTGVTDRCNDASTNGLTGLCTNLYCTGLNG